MDQATREEITAAAAAHKELGPHFDSAVAESLVDRIGDEIDRRVEARLGKFGERRATRRPAAAAELRPVQHSWSSVVLALGSMGIAIGATAAILSMTRGVSAAGAVSNNIGPGQVFLCVLIWLVVGVVNVSYNRRR